jgi:hypothetical protein
VELPATVTPWFVTGRVELLNMIVVGARKRKRPTGSPPITTLGEASRAVPAVFLLRDTRASSRMPQFLDSPRRVLAESAILVARGASALRASSTPP